MSDDPLDDLLRDAARSYNDPPPVPRELMWGRIEAARREAATPPAPARRGAPWLRTAAGIAAVLLLGIAIGRTTRDAGTGDATVHVATSATPSPEAGAPGSPADAPSPVRAEEATTREDASAAGLRGGPPMPRSVGDDRRRAGSGRPLLVARMPHDAGVARGRDGRTYGVPRNTPGAVGEGTEMNAYRLAVVEHLARTEVLLTGFRSRERADGRMAAPADAEQFGRLSRELLQNTRLLLATRATDDPLLQRLLEDLELVLMQIAQYAADGGARRGDLDAINQSLDRRNVLPKLRSTIPAGAPAPAGT